MAATPAGAVEPRGPFSLAAAARFWAGFPPAGRPDADASPTLRLAFVADDLRTRLRLRPADEALGALQRIRGIGPFSAELVLARASGATDVPPVYEPRVRGAAAVALGLPEAPDAEAFARLAAPWSPFRAWVCLLLRAVHGSRA